jgi:DNA-binding MarR family transcriptional regulator
MTGRPDRTAVSDETLRLVSAVERAVTQRLDDALRSCGADVDQWRVLSLLAERGGCPMSVVAEHALLLAPKLSKLVDRMVSANLVLRRPDDLDRRRVLVFASARGRAALAEWDAAVRDVRREVGEVLGADAAQFDALLLRLSRGLAGRPVPGGELAAGS